MTFAPFVLSHAPSSDHTRIYAVLTAEKRLRIKGPIAMSRHAYHFKYESPKKLAALQVKYPEGGSYKGETIISTCILEKNSGWEGCHGEQ